ncbi:MAG: hypothetical protein F4X82_01755 [Candidatus Spechtbacteria bacterium SB0662_bin_43]|uniref:Uncharacterized protein n=1 Tax=Candidatus Spechtbacteria bacterium SB0662_bin_43 TaxID=2604897 RepID=A0A845DA42_9BACT|nr:hypothetical protein [Candidatus Spechtbacteria bacterium SB0662_bin_43]
MMEKYIVSVVFEKEEDASKYLDSLVGNEPEGSACATHYYKKNIGGQSGCRKACEEKNEIK